MSEEPKKSLLAGAGRYSIGSILGMAGRIARVALTARMLSPEDAGTWLGLQLILGYGANLHFGVLFGMFRNVPVARARGDDDGADKVIRTSFTFVLGGTLLGALVTVPVAVRFAQSSGRVALATALLLAVTLLRSYYATLFKAEGRFAELGAVGAIGGVVSVITLPLIWLFGVEGVLLGMLAQACVEGAYMLVRVAMPRFGLEMTVLRQQLSLGMMTLLTSVGMVLLTSIDRTVMLRRVGPAETGLYYLGANVLLLLPALAALPFDVLTPRYFERVGRGEDLMPLLADPLRLTAKGFAPLIAVGATLVDPVIHTFFPNLRGGENATLIAIAVSYPLVLATFAPHVFYALDRQLPSVLMIIGCSLAGIGAAVAAAWLGGGIAWIAAGAGVGQVLYHVVTTVGATALIGRPLRTGLAMALGSFGPGLLMAALAFGLRVGLARVLPDALWPRSILAFVIVALVGAPCAPDVRPGSDAHVALRLREARGVTQK